MSTVDRVSQLVAQLEGDILTGKLQAGELLPSERELSSQLGISRSVVREALSRLASMGLVKITHGSGTRVQAPDHQQVTVAYQRLLTRNACKLDDLGAVRLPLESAIAAAAAEHRTDEQLARLRATQEVMGDPGRTLEEHVRADLDFHAILAEATGNPLFQTVLAPIQELLIQSRYRTLGKYGIDIAFAHHGRILAAVEQHNAAVAVEAMRLHMQANQQHLSSLTAQVETEFEL